MNVCKRGFSLMELLIGLVIATIVTLMVGALANIAFKSYNDLRKQSDVYNDSQFALQMIREGVRQSSSAPSVSVVGGNNCLTVIKPSVTNYFYIKGSNFVYSSTACDSLTNTPIIKSVTSLVFTPSISGNLVTAVLSGTKSGVSFSYSIKTARRN